MKFKKTGVAILAASLTIAGSSFALADENLFKSADETTEITTNESLDTTTDVTTEENTTTEQSDTNVVDVSDLITESEENKETEDTGATEVVEPTEDTTESEAETTSEDNNKVSKFPEIPAGYTAGNLVALKQAYENAGNDTAKAAIVRNAERAIAKFEAKQAAKKQETTTDETKAPATKPILEETTKQATKTQVKTLKEEHKQEKKELREKQKEEKQALKAEHKSELEALKPNHNAEKQAGKNKK